ncbi:MAG: hypothetical protein ACREBI_04335 [Nitrosotalea sp.]
MQFRLSDVAPPWFSPKLWPSSCMNVPSCSATDPTSFVNAPSDTMRLGPPMSAQPEEVGVSLSSSMNIA